jgi:hypothetical protein
MAEKKEEVFLSGLEDLDPSEEWVCMLCKTPITPQNNSGWEGFVRTDNGTIKTQPICKDCEAKPKTVEKLKEEEPEPPLDTEQVS